MSCPPGVELLGIERIDPDQTIYLVCSIRNAIDLQWRVNGNNLVIEAFRLTQYYIDSASLPNTIAVLLERNVDSTLIGNRTSLLQYKPDPGFTGTVTISCKAAGIDPCLLDVSVGGEYNYFIHMGHVPRVSCPYIIQSYSPSLIRRARDTDT